jgi:ATP-dependent helicase/DNAse subunit B
MSQELKLSASKCKTFSTCKKQYKYTYILNLPQKERDFFVFGKFLHLVLETFHQYYIDGCLLSYHISMNDAFKVAWAKYKDKMTSEMKAECWDILANYLQKITKAKNNGHPFNIIAVEKEFNYQLTEDIILRGYIDVVAKDGDNVLHVADWKTSKNKKYQENNWDQLACYCFILLLENPNLTKIRASYIMLRHSFEMITKEFEAKEILTERQKYIDYAEKIRNEKDFIASPNNLCSWCSFLDICEQGRVAVSGSYNQQNLHGEINW